VLDLIGIVGHFSRDTSLLLMPFFLLPPPFPEAASRFFFLLGGGVFLGVAGSGWVLVCGRGPFC